LRSGWNVWSDCDGSDRGARSDRTYEMNDLLRALNSTKLWILLAVVPWLCVVSYFFGRETATLRDDQAPHGITVVNQLSTQLEIDSTTLGPMTKLALNKFLENAKKERSK
jgi:hypothetical protein